MALISAHIEEFNKTLQNPLQGSLPSSPTDYVSLWLLKGCLAKKKKDWFVTRLKSDITKEYVTATKLK